jgi:hypothetical protein
LRITSLSCVPEQAERGHRVSRRVGYAHGDGSVKLNRDQDNLADVLCKEAPSSPWSGIILVIAEA